MKRYGFIVLLLSFFLCTSVYAEDIKSINMDINIDQNGTAHVKEVWTVYFDSGESTTEVYKAYNNIGESSFTNFKVSLNNIDFTNIDWDIDKDFNYKAYKNGINYISGGVELCWGISEKGSTNVYNISYDITNFVAKLQDYDMVYWTLVPHNLGDSPESIYIKIYSDFMSYSDTLDVWGFGKYGAYTYVYDGYIEMSTDDGLDSDEYMTILVKYPKDTFTNTNNIDEDFDYYLNMAKEGSTEYNDDDNGYISSFFDIFLEYFYIIIIIFGSIFSIKIKSSNKTGTKKIMFRKEDKKLPKEVNYIREIPCNKNIYRAYWLSKVYNLNKKETDLLGAVLLKWLNEGKIEIRKDVSTGLFKKEKSSIVLKQNVNFETKEELSLYQMLVEASGDYVLEANEFKKWAQRKYSRILNWFGTVLDSETINLANENKLTQLSKNKYQTTGDLYNDAVVLKGFKKFLIDFSRMYEKAPIEVALWKEYLMFAQIFGIADEVAKNFKNIYPDVISDEYMNDIDFIYFVSYTGISSANTARSRAESYHSGGGGFSSGGGGGGSFGGGGFGGGGAR